jgi:hypothetical protein
MTGRDKVPVTDGRDPLHGHDDTKAKPDRLRGECGLNTDAGYNSDRPVKYVTEKSRRTAINLWRVITGISATMIVSLAVHALALSALHVPLPDQSVKSWLPFRFASDIGFSLAVASCFDSARRVSGAGAPAWRSVALTLFILCCLNETLRQFFMNAYCARPFVYAVVFLGLITLADAQYLVGGLALTVVVALLVRHATLRFASMILAAMILTAGVFPLVGQSHALIMAVAGSYAPVSSWCSPPFGASVLIPAYLSLLEPVLATLLCAAIVQRNPHRRLLTFVVMILALKKQLFAPLLYMAFSNEAWDQAFLSMAQFTFETIAMAAGAWLTWLWAAKPQMLPLSSVVAGQHQHHSGQQ